MIVSLLALPIAAMATPGAGFVFNFINRFTSTTDAIHEHAHDKGWSVELEVQGATDFVEQDVMLAPGGFSGWHSHPGPVLITVKSGTATGSAFIEPANAHHYVANKGSDNLTGDLHHSQRAGDPPGAAAAIAVPDHGGGNELLSNWVLIARVSKDCERTHGTLNGDLLVKVIDEHDVLVYVANL